MTTKNTLREELDAINQTIKYEEAMLESAEKYPTNTAQFYSAMEQTRKKISFLKQKRDLLLSELSTNKEGEEQ